MSLFSSGGTDESVLVRRFCERGVGRTRKTHKTCNARVLVRRFCERGVGHGMLQSNKGLYPLAHPVLVRRFCERGVGQKIKKDLPI